MSCEPVHFVCLKWGTKYPASYVNRLYHMVQRNLTRPFQFHCLTEDSTGLDSAINHLPLETTSLRGWWYKLALFKKDFFGLRGNLVYLDLDVVIVGNIDFLVDQPGNFLIIRNWSRNKMWNSSVMRFQIGSYSAVWEDFQANQDSILETLHGDQEWIYHCVPEAENWPGDRIVSYKKSLNSKAFRWLEKLGGGRLGLRAPDWMDTPLTRDAAIVIFHGKPDPEDVADSSYGFWKRASFIKKNWY